jgi:hypothetical protein
MMRSVSNSYGIMSMVPPEEDVWYILRYDTDYGMIIMTYYNQTLAISKQRPIQKVIKQTYAKGPARAAFSMVLDNYKAKDEDYKIEYQPVKIFEKPVDKRWDLTDIANNIKDMPEDFRRFVFSVQDNDSKIVINSFITKHDIDTNLLDSDRMNTYLEGLEDFTKGDRLSGL